MQLLHYRRSRRRIYWTEGSLTQPNAHKVGLIITKTRYHHLTAAGSVAPISSASRRSADDGHKACPPLAEGEGGLELLLESEACECPGEAGMVVNGHAMETGSQSSALFILRRPLRLKPWTACIDVAEYSAPRHRHEEWAPQPRHSSSVMRPRLRLNCTPHGFRRRGLGARSNKGCAN